MKIIKNLKTHWKEQNQLASRAPGNGCHQPHEGTHSSHPLQIRPKSQMMQMRNLQHGHLMWENGSVDGVRKCIKIQLHKRDSHNQPWCNDLREHLKCLQKTLQTAQANFFFFVSKSIVQVIDFEARNNSWAPKSTTTVSPPIETFPFQGQWLESIGQNCLRENHRKGNHMRGVCVCAGRFTHTWKQSCSGLWCWRNAAKAQIHSESQLLSFGLQQQAENLTPQTPKST